MFKLQRYSKNPILTPIKEHPWESKMVFNPAAALKDNKVHLIYRAMGEDEIDGYPISRLGACVLKNDGVTIEKRYEKPILEPKKWYEPAGCEDPRITEIDGKYYLLYTAYLGYNAPPLFKEEKTNIAMAVSDDLFHWKRFDHLLLPDVFEPEKNGVLFPKKINGYYVLFYRIEPSIYVAYTKNLTPFPPKWIGHKVIATPRENSWDSWKIGAGAPPIETKDGWLLIYHGIDRRGVSRREKKKKDGKKEERIYRLGVMLLDKEDPEKILYRSKNWILEPEEPYEKEGAVPNVVFTCGAVVIKDTLFVYYGGADTVIGVATCSLKELLSAIKKGEV
ncbi:MAG TPA: glycosidase [Candidatus Pacearchaeota archaeon]|nr:glycosidase [Candidatus Pacearchaeota archaeon]HPZ74535.1 glycosidase [Candidatus Pacearchaeota archaeon]HQD89128.1 glycosidase [Candidatus Pacearchaeota archaeon]